MTNFGKYEYHPEDVMVTTHIFDENFDDDLSILEAIKEEGLIKSAIGFFTLAGTLGASIFCLFSIFGI